MQHNVICTIKQFSGNEKNRTQTSLATAVPVLLTPLSADYVALYPDLPIGGSYSFVLYDDSINIPPESELSITDAEVSEFTTSDKFVVKDLVQKFKVGGRFLHKGICVKVV